MGLPMELMLFIKNIGDVDVWQQKLEVFAVPKGALARLQVKNAHQNANAKENVANRKRYYLSKQKHKFHKNKLSKRKYNLKVRQISFQLVFIYTIENSLKIHKKKVKLLFYQLKFRVNFVIVQSHATDDVDVEQPVHFGAIALFNVQNVENMREITWILWKKKLEYYFGILKPLD